MQRLNWMTTTVEKSVKHYIEWPSQSTTRLEFCWLYEGIMVIHCIHCIHCIHWLSASKVTCVWVISVEDDFLLGYQCRRWHIVRLSASKMILFWVVSVEDDSFWKFCWPIPWIHLYKLRRTHRRAVVAVVGRWRWTRWLGGRGPLADLSRASRGPLADLSFFLFLGHD